MEGKFGLSERNICELYSIFSSIPEIEEVIIYGSRARGDHKPGSDIDMTLKGDNLTRLHLAILSDKLYYSNIPYFFDTSIFAKLRNPDFIANIERDGKVLYKRDVSTSF